MFKEIDMSIFPKERQEKLDKIMRYSMFDKMYYRSSVYFHTKRILWLIEKIIPEAKKYLDFDEEKIRVLALVHDDAEIVTGDIQAGHKARMSKEELELIKQNELKAISKMIEDSPKEVSGYNYEELLKESAEKNSIEAKLVSYIDKMDGYCESLHDVFAGNICLIRSSLFYDNLITLFPYKFPELVPLLKNGKHPLLDITDRVSPLYIESKNYIHLNKPHTKESILIDTDLPFYNFWRQTILEHSSEGGLDYLINQKEI